MCREKVKRQIEREKKIVQILSTLCGALTRSPGSVLRSRAVSETSLTLNSLSLTTRRIEKNNVEELDAIFFFFASNLRRDSARRIRCWDARTTVRSNRMRYPRGNILRPTSSRQLTNRTTFSSRRSRFVLGRQNPWAACGQSFLRWTTLTGFPRNRRATYRFSAPPKDSRYRFIGTIRTHAHTHTRTSLTRSKEGKLSRLG